MASLLTFYHRECTRAEHLDGRMLHCLNRTGALKTEFSLSTVRRCYAERAGGTIDHHQSATSCRFPWTQKIAVFDMLSSLNFSTAAVRASSFGSKTCQRGDRPKLPSSGISMVFYNTRRRHSYLGVISPLAFKAMAA